MRAGPQTNSYEGWTRKINLQILCNADQPALIPLVIDH